MAVTGDTMDGRAALLVPRQLPFAVLLVAAGRLLVITPFAAERRLTPAQEYHVAAALDRIEAEHRHNPFYGFCWFDPERGDRRTQMPPPPDAWVARMRWDRLAYEL